MNQVQPTFNQTPRSGNADAARGGVPARGRQGRVAAAAVMAATVNTTTRTKATTPEGTPTCPTITKDIPAGDPRAAAADTTAAVTRGGRTAEDAAMIGGGSPTEATDAGSKRYTVILLCR
jgi:hypothetical protein